MRALCVLVSGLCLGAYCVGCTPSFPTNVELSGTWRGTQSSAVYPGFQPITLTLTQNGIDFSGRYTCESRDCLASSGIVSGYVDRDRFQATITFPDGRGTARVAGNVNNGTQITGSYAASIIGTFGDQGAVTLRRD